MKRKVKHIESRKDELEQFRVDFLEAVKQQVPSSSTVQKSALSRMQEEHEKKRLLAEWKSSESDEQIQHIRKTILLQQDEATQLNLRIINLQKELQGLRQLEAKVFSSHRIMSEERHKRVERPPQERLKAEPVAVPKAKAQPAAPVLRSHQLRMAEQQARKAEARAARLAASYAASPSTYAPVSPSSFASSSSSSSSSKGKQLP